MSPAPPELTLTPGTAGLRVRNLRKSYRRRPVIRDISLDLSRGEIVALLGPNGSGKTTCFYAIAGLVMPEGGSVTLDGRDVTALPMYRRARLGIGYLPQEVSIFRGLTVEENIRAVLEIIVPDRHKRRERLEELLSDFSITHIQDRGIGVLITDHNVRETLDIVDRAYILHEGTVLMSGTSDEVVRDENVRRVYLGRDFRIG